MEHRKQQIRQTKNQNQQEEQRRCNKSAAVVVIVTRTLHPSVGRVFEEPLVRLVASAGATRTVGIPST